MEESERLRVRTTSNSVRNFHILGNDSSPIARSNSLASVHSVENNSETDQSEIISPVPRRHYLLQQQSSHIWLQGNSPPSTRPSSPLNPNYTHSRRYENLSSLVIEEHAPVKRLPAPTGMARRWVRVMHKGNLRKWTVPSAILAAILVKWTTGLGSYSGQGSPPMYGDYEAQRHWMEITYHLPIHRWYTYDLQYWGLDYPPLTAYVSWLCGLIAHKIDPSWVALDSSRGIETPASKIFTRLSVLSFDLLIYIPSLYLFTRTWLGKRSTRAQHNALLALLFQPALILIDSGHFQYNSVMLGLTLQAINFFFSGNDLLGAVCFVLALGFKQMALYYSPAVFAYLLGKCFLLGSNHGTKLFIQLGIVTITSFLLLFSPFLRPPELLIAVITRIFPFARGLFEDKVANFWCASNVVIKWKNYFQPSTLPKLATLLTATSFLPSMVALILPGLKATVVAAPTERPATLSLLPYALFQSSLSFFLFSFQVHEKSILIPLLPITLLLAATNPGPGSSSVWEWGVLINNVACFSMWPLLKRDGLAIQYIALILLWNRLIGYNPFTLTALKPFSLLVYTGILLLHVSELIFAPPTRLPDLFPVLNVLLSAGVFGLAYLWSLKRILEISWAMGGINVSSSAKTSKNNGDPHRKRAPSLSPSPAASLRRRVISTTGSSATGVALPTVDERPRVTSLSGSQSKADKRRSLPVRPGVSTLLKPEHHLE